jgi:DHA1 family bicyclomycin/chloramphenicol resistance-like MFS transporter
MQMYGVSEQGYGLIFGLVAGGLILSSQVNARLLKRYSSEQIIGVALPLQGLAGLGLFTGALLGNMGLYAMLALILVFLSCQGFIFPNTSALSMAPFSTHAGSASALLGAIQMSVGAVSAALVSAFSNHTALPMTGTMAACAIVSYLVLRSDGRILRYKPSRPDVEEETIDSLINTGQ